MKPLLIAGLLFSARPAFSAPLEKTPDNETAEPVEIVLYQRGYDEARGNPGTLATKQAVELFAEAHPGVKVRVEGIGWGRKGTAALNLALTARTDINLFRVSSHDLPRYASEGLLSEVGPHLSQEDKADFFPNAFDGARYKGKIFAWPLWVTAKVILANTDIFKERGVELPSFDKPWSWAEFVEACRYLSFSRKDASRFYGVSMSAKPSPLPYIDGGRRLSPDGKKFLGAEPEFVSGLQKTADLSLRYHCTAPGYGTAEQRMVHDQFRKARNVAMDISVSGFIRTLEKEKFPFAVLPLPIGASSRPVTTGAFGLYAVVDLPEKEKVRAAHELARWLTGSEVGSKVKGYQMAPGLRASNRNLEDDPYFRYVASAAVYGVYEPPVGVPSEVVEEFDKDVRAVLLGEKSAGEAMQALAPVYQKALDEFNE